MLDRNRKKWQNGLLLLAPYAVICLILVIVPPFLPGYFLSMLTKVLLFAIFAISLDIIIGYTGLLSLGHAAFLGVAGYTSGILMVRYGINDIWILLPAAIVVAAIFAAVIGYLCIRVSGVFFLIVTLAFGQLLYIAAMKWRTMTGGTDGLIDILYPDLGLPGFSLTPFSYYYLVFIIFVICYFLLRRITNSAFGRALIGIRENEVRMQALGYNTWAHRYLAFIIGGTFSGVAGVLFAHFYGAMVPEHFGIRTSITAILMVIIGGAGTLFGPFIGAFVVVLLEHVASIYSPERWPLILGGIFILSVLFLRGGISVYVSKLWRKVTQNYGSVES